MKRTSLLRLFGNYDGSTVIFVAVTMLLLLAFAALAVDVGHLYVVRGELQNAADSGALAGAQVLYDDPTTDTDIPGAQVYGGADALARTFVIQNSSENTPVLVESSERGHWRFGTPGVFTPNNSLLPYDLWNRTTAQLNEDTNFINAVRVITRRKRDINNELPADFFGRILGDQRAEVMAVAVGYIGFAGTLGPHAVDQPIAICRQAITVNDVYSCGVGRMLNSGQNAGHQTAGWTNFAQPCSTASASDLSPLICATGNPVALNMSQTVGTTNGTQTGPSYDGIRDCWQSTPGLDPNGDTWPEQPWSITLAVIDCGSDVTVGNCSTLVGAVELNVLWITRNDKNQMNEVPRKMADWPPLTGPGSELRGPTGLCAGTGLQCWDSFVAHFHLQDVLNGSPAIYEDKTIYFLPDCTPHEPTGATGGENFGILAKIPVLVK